MVNRMGPVHVQVLLPVLGSVAIAKEAAMSSLLHFSIKD